MENYLLNYYKILISLRKNRSTIYSIEKFINRKINITDIQSINILFNLNLELDLEEILLSEEDKTRLDLFPKNHLEHIEYLIALQSQFNDELSKKRFDDAILLICEKLFLSFSIESDIVNWTISQEDLNLNYLKMIDDAIRESKELGLRYFSLNSKSTDLRTIDPYFLKKHMGKVYLIAYCHKNDDFRTFSLSRIRGLTFSGKSFERKINIDEERLFKDSIGIYMGNRNPQQIRLRCHKTILQIIKEHPIHKSQEVILDSDDYFSVKFQSVITEELKRKLMEFGSDLEVLYPNSLIELIKNEAEEILKKY
jgi:predicted DNA-binding transcriptional regulator YafY